MEMKCGVIQDLLPSYADGICSEDSKRLILEHLETCPDCAGRLERMKSSKMDSDGGRKEIDYLKKIRRAMEHRKLVGGIMLCLLLLLQIWFACHPRMGSLQVEGGAFILLALVMLLAAGVADSFQVNVGRGRLAAGLALSAGILLGMLASVEYFLRSLLRDRLSFFREEYDVGPFCLAVCVGVIAAEGALLLWHAFGKGKNAYVTFIAVAGINLAGSFAGILYDMSTLEATLCAVRERELTQLGILAVGALLFAGITVALPRLRDK